MSELMYFVITIAILVFIHEFGHFAAAKLSGMRVDAFAIGFGYRLFGYNKKSGFSYGPLAKDFDGEGNTDYRLCLLPLGGYVKIAGMVDESMDTSFAESEPKPWEFRSKSTSKKVFVITAGVAMNLFLAVAIFWGSNFFYGKQYTKTTTIGAVHQGSAAELAGFQSHDKILSVNGTPVNYWEDIRTEVFINTMGKDLKVKVKRNNEDVWLSVPRKKIPSDESKGMFLTTENLKPVVGDVLKNSKADSAGVKINDILLKIDNVELVSVEQTIQTISSSKGNTLSLAVLRDKDTVALSVTPNNDGKIGILLGGYIYLGPTERIAYGAFESIALSVKDISRMTELTFVMLKNVITGKIEMGKAFGGPIRIAQFAARSADSGLSSFLMFLALLSLNLAIINILPLPVLDGGHLIVILIEGFIKRELPIKVKIAIQNTGLVLFFLLTAFIIYNDILNM
ncbi:MAG: RIP metalloprotease RseP [Ignavibacteria bacterium]|nr:RIP metalloprotease RseP [Ignavibacteria bacterium]